MRDPVQGRRSGQPDVCADVRLRRHHRARPGGRDCRAGCDHRRDGDDRRRKAFGNHHREERLQAVTDRPQALQFPDPADTQFRCPRDARDRDAVAQDRQVVVIELCEADKPRQLGEEGAKPKRIRH
jgi:hypothetical protein